MKALLLFAVAACSTRTGNVLPIPIDDGGPPSTDAGTMTECPEGDLECDPPLGIPPPRPRDCATGSEWIYLIASSVPQTEESPPTLLKYEPHTERITVVGQPSCPERLSPFSMAVDRDGTAYVLSARGTRGIFRVSTTDASCEATSYVPDVGGWQEFGMGFAADSRDATSERLYVVGGPEALIHRPGAENLFGVLDLDSMAIETRSRVLGPGELTGTGEGNLWAFLTLTEGDVITKLDPVTAARSTTYPLHSLSATFARAVAFWGGDFYVFVAPRNGESRIHRLRTRTGRVTEIGLVEGFNVVGAGVSTCAPYELI